MHWPRTRWTVGSRSCRRPSPSPPSSRWRNFGSSRSSECFAEKKTRSICGPSTTTSLREMVRGRTRTSCCARGAEPKRTQRAQPGRRRSAPGPGSGVGKLPHRNRSHQRNPKAAESNRLLTKHQAETCPTGSRGRPGPRTGPRVPELVSGPCFVTYRGKTWSTLGGTPGQARKWSGSSAATYRASEVHQGGGPPRARRREGEHRVQSAVSNGGTSRTLMGPPR